jgi:hypothetical protein
LFAPFENPKGRSTTANEQQGTTPPTTTTIMTTSATEDQTRKRVRITDPAELSSITRSSVTQDFALRSFASLPTPIKSLATHYTAKLTSLQNKARQRSITLEKMAEEAFVPTSARIKFELGATQKVRETSTFTTLAETTKTLVETFQKALKTNMVTVAKLEMTQIHSDIDTTLLESVRDLATISVMNHFPEGEHYPRTARNLAWATIEDHFDELKTYSTLEQESVFTKYKELSADPDAPYETGHLTAGGRLHIACLIPELFSTLKKINVDSWKEQLDAILKKKKLLELDGYVKTTLTEKVTADTAMLLDEEPTIEPAIIKSLIAKGVTDATKDLKKTVERLQQTIERSSTQKNSRGAKPRASSTKKTNSSSVKKKSKKPNDQAAGSDSDTSQGNGIKKKKTKQTKSTQRNKPSSKNSASRKKK